MSNEGGVTPFEAIREVALRGVTLVSGKGALGTRRFSVTQAHPDTEPEAMRTVARDEGTGQPVVWGPRQSATYF